MKYLCLMPSLAIMMQILFFDFTQALDSNAPMSTAPPSSLQKRDAGVATVTLGPIGGYVRDPAQARNVNLTDIQLLIFPAPPPSKGVDVYLSPPLLQFVAAVVRENCMTNSSTNCESSIARVLPLGQIEIQLRNNPEIKLSAIAVVAVIVGLVRHPKRDELGGGLWQLGEFDKFAGMSASPSSTIVVHTADDDKNPLTIVSTARPRPTIIREDNGDVTIKLDSHMADTLNDLMGKIQGCRFTRKRGLDVSCLVDSASALLSNALGGPAADLGIPVEEVPQPGGEGLDASQMLIALQLFIISARAIFDRFFAGLVAQAVDNTQLQLMVFWVAFIIGTGERLRVDNKISAKRINQRCKLPQKECTDDDCEGKSGVCSIGDQAGCICQEEECPPNDRTPSCINCGGDNGSRICPGLKEHEDLWKGCKCHREGKAQMDKFTLNEVPSLNFNLLMKGPPRTPGDKRKTCDRILIPMSKPLFEGLIAAFCKGHLLQTPKQGDLTTKDAKINGDWEDFANLIFNFSWTPRNKGRECFDTCQGVFSSFFGERCSTPGKDEMSHSAQFTHDCGTATYYIVVPSPPDVKITPPYVGNRCSVKVRQWDNRETGKKGGLTADPTNKWKSSYSIEVTIRDGNYTKIGNHSRVSAGPIGNERWEQTKPLELVSKLETKMIITPLMIGDYVQFELPGRLSWPSNNQKGDVNATCDYESDSQKWAEIAATAKEDYQMAREINCEFDCTYRNGKSSDSV